MTQDNSIWSEEARVSLTKSLMALTRVISVLIIEDNSADVALLDKLLKEFPCQMTSVPSEPAAISLFSERDFDLTFLDLKLAPGSGLQVMATAKALGRKTGFVVLTGYDDKESAKEAIRLGAVAVLTKPPTTEQLRTIFGAVPKGGI